MAFAEPPGVCPYVYCTDLNLPLDIYGDLAKGYRVVKIGKSNNGANNRELNGGCVKHFAGCVCPQFAAPSCFDALLPPRSCESIKCDFKVALGLDCTDSSLDLVLKKLASVLEQSLLAELRKFSLTPALRACYSVAEREKLHLDGFTECACTPEDIDTHVRLIYTEHMPSWLRANVGLLRKWQAQLEAEQKQPKERPKKSDNIDDEMAKELSEHVLRDLRTSSALAAPAANLMVALWFHKLLKQHGSCALDVVQVSSLLFQALQATFPHIAHELSKDPIISLLPIDPFAQLLASSRGQCDKQQQRISKAVQETYHTAVPNLQPELSGRQSKIREKKTAKAGLTVASLYGSELSPGGLPLRWRDPLQPRASLGCMLLPMPRAAPPRASDGALPRAFASLNVSRPSCGGAPPHVPGMIRQPRSSYNGASQQSSVKGLQPCRAVGCGL